MRSAAPSGRAVADPAVAAVSSVICAFLQRVAGEDTGGVVLPAQRSQAGQVCPEGRFDLGFRFLEAWTHFDAVDADGVPGEHAQRPTRPVVAGIAVGRIRPDRVEWDVPIDTPANE